MLLPALSISTELDMDVSMDHPTRLKLLLKTFPIKYLGGFWTIDNSSFLPFLFKSVFRTLQGLALELVDRNSCRYKRFGLICQSPGTRNRTYLISGRLLARLGLNPS